MKLNNKENIELLKYCCTVNEMDCLLKSEESAVKSEVDKNYYDTLTESYKNIYNALNTSNNINWNDLKQQFKEKQYQDFFNEMETYNKHVIQSKYYKKAVNTSKQIHPDIDNTIISKDLHDRFFNYKMHLEKTVISRKKYNRLRICAAAAVAIAGLTIHQAYNKTYGEPANKKQIETTSTLEPSTPTQTEAPTPTPEPTQTPKDYYLDER